MAKLTLHRDAAVLARAHTEKAVETMADLLESLDPRVRLAAAQAILDRGHGKPINAVITIPGNRAQRQALAAMTDEELDGAIEAEFGELPELPPPAPVPALPAPGQSLDALDDPLLA